MIGRWIDMIERYFVTVEGCDMVEDIATLCGSIDPNSELAKHRRAILLEPVNMDLPQSSD
jgi:hypothetical protein